MNFISKSISRTVWALRARDILFLPAAALYTDLRYPRWVKTCPWSKRFTVPSLVEIGARIWICIVYTHTHRQTHRHKLIFIFKTSR